MIVEVSLFKDLRSKPQFYTVLLIFFFSLHLSAGGVAVRA